jgi:hypothetical protein
MSYYFPPVFNPLWKPKRYKIFYGGRGSAKTWTLAAAIIILCHQRKPVKGEPFRVLCGREFQNSIAESVYYEMRGAISRLGLTPHFKFTGHSIVNTTTGAQILFRGTHNSIDQVKSFGGIDLFWGEEAHSMSLDSLIYIDPTIRRDPPFGPFGHGSELWFTLNQTLDEDPIYVKYKLAQGAWEDERHLIVPCTWKDNYIRFEGKYAMEWARHEFPEKLDKHFVRQDNGDVHVITFPQVLEDQRADSFEHDDRGHYEWVWGTQCRNLGGIFFDLGQLLVNHQPIEWPNLCDTVFAIIDTATKTGNEHDGTAVTYFATNAHGTGFPLMILDYDYNQIEGSLLESWLPTVFRNCKEYAEKCRARFGSIGVLIEDKASGMVLLQQAARKGWPARPIDSDLTSVGKTERAISVSGYVNRGKVKFTRPAFDKIVTYKGVTLNHLVHQVKRFRVGDKDMIDDDLLDTFTYGIAVSLGNSEGF